MNNKIIEKHEDVKSAMLKDKTFLIKLKYNQNNNVQGCIEWIEKRKVVCFRSLMELMTLLQEAGELENRDWKSEDAEETLQNMIR